MMENKNLKNTPIAAAFVFDNADDRLRAMAGTPSLEISLANTFQECMQRAVLVDGIRDMRIIAYEFPDLASIPRPSQKSCRRYYHDLLIPAVDKLGLKPCVELHAQEVVFAMLHDLPIELNKPGNGIRQQAGYTEHCRSFRGGFIDLMGKGTTVVLPSGEEVGFGLQSAALQGVEVVSTLKQKAPHSKNKAHKHGIR